MEYLVKANTLLYKVSGSRDNILSLLHSVGGYFVHSVGGCYIV